MTMIAIYNEHGSDWSHQVSAMATTHQTLPLSVMGVACEVGKLDVCRLKTS